MRKKQETEEAGKVSLKTALVCLPPKKICFVTVAAMVTGRRLRRLTSPSLTPLGR